MKEVVDAFGSVVLETLLMLNLTTRNLHVWQGGRLTHTFPVAVGRLATPTPVGVHKIHRKEKNAQWLSPWSGRRVDASPLGPIGTRWIGFWYECKDGKSTDKNPPEFDPGRCKEIGFHGTGMRESIGHEASNGCVRMRDEDAVRLYELVDVGAEVQVFY